MRTIEEVREIVHGWLDDPTTIPVPLLQWSHRTALMSVLDLIDSPQPCKHPNARFYPKSNSIYPDVNGYPATFCPDCGKRLVDPPK